MNIRTTLAAALLLGAALGQAQIAKQGSAYLFRMKFTKGAKYAYKMNVDMTMPKGMGGPADGKANMLMTMNIHVKDVKKDVATVAYSASPMKMNGKEMGKATQMEVKQNTRGKFVQGDAAAMNAGSINLPEKPIKLGDSWTAETKMGTGAGAMTVNAKYTFKSIKTVNGKQIAVLGVTMASSTPVKLNGGGTVELYMSDGALYASDTTATLLPTADASQKITVVSKMRRV